MENYIWVNGICYIKGNDGSYYFFDNLTNEWVKDPNFNEANLNNDNTIKRIKLNSRNDQSNVAGTSIIHTNDNNFFSNSNANQVNSTYNNQNANGGNMSLNNIVYTPTDPNYKKSLWFESLAIRNVSYRYKKNNYLSLDNVSIKIDQGQFHVFTGDNGAGKSTLIKTIVGVNKEYEGVITINGRNVIDEPEVKSVVSYVSDNPVFPDYFNVYEYLYAFCVQYYDSKSTIKNKISKLVEQFFGSTDFLKSNPNKLSLGQRKKVLLIRALLEKAEIIILDEPVANLDPTTKLQILKLLKEIQNSGVAIFISTHLLDDMKNFATHLSLISKGKILFSGPVDSDEFIKINYEYFGSKSTEQDLSAVIKDVVLED